MIEMKIMPGLVTDTKKSLTRLVTDKNKDTEIFSNG